MSFRAQEQALFDLLFDTNLRERFCRDPRRALAAYGLSEAEQRDFDAIRPDGLRFDAELRVDLILAQACRTYPLTFSLASSLSDGVAMLRELVDVQTMRTPPNKRFTRFGMRYREKLATRLARENFPAAMQTDWLAIVDAEVGMAWTAAGLRQVALGALVPEERGDIPADWTDRPVKVADHVSASMLPAPYERLKQALCPCTGAGLWHHLGLEPLPVRVRDGILRERDPRVLAARARLVQASACEPVADHVIAELAEGFAPLLSHLDGRQTVRSLLRALREAGAPEALLASVESGFGQLIRSGMLALA